MKSGPSTPFDEKFSMLLAFVKSNKRFPAKKENELLYNFMSVLRKKKKFEDLPLNLILKLEKIQFAWDAHEHNWEYNCNQLLKLGEDKNWRNLILEQVKLEKWLHFNIKLYYSGELNDKRKVQFKYLMKKLKIEADNNLFVYQKIKYTKMFSGKWMKLYSLVKEYMITHNKTPPYKIFPLYYWCKNQKDNFEKLSHEQQQLLNDFNFLSYFNRWEMGYKPVYNFYKLHKRLPEREDNRGMFYWWKYQKIRWKENKLTDDQIVKLKKIGLFIESVTHLHWMDKFEKLRRFRQKNPYRWPSLIRSKEVELAKWMTSIRQQNKYIRKDGSRNISIQQIKLLNSIGFRWTRSELKDEQWEIVFNQIIELKNQAKKGNYHREDKQASKYFKQWVYYNKKQHLKGELSKHRYKKLKAAKIL